MKSNMEMIDSVIREVEEYNMKKKQYGKKRLMVVSLVAIMLVVLCIGAGAKKFMPIFSDQWVEQISENVSKASSTEEVEAFDEKIRSSDDKFAKKTLENQSGVEVLPDYNESYKQGVTAELGEYRFYLDSVVKAQQKYMTVTDGSLADGTAEFQWVVSDAYYAIVELSRKDGGKLTEEDAYNFYRWNVLVEGYEPESTEMCLRGNMIDCCEDNKIYYAVELTEAMKFAGRDFALAVFEGDEWLSRDNFYADKEGTMEIKGENGVLLRFSVPEKFADKKAVKAFLKEYCMNDNFNGYEK